MRDGCTYDVIGDTVAAAANPNDRIQIAAGTYTEPTILIDRPPELVGEGSATTIVDGGGGVGTDPGSGGSFGVYGATARADQEPPPLSMNRLDVSGQRNNGILLEDWKAPVTLTTRRSGRPPAAATGRTGPVPPDIARPDRQLRRHPGA